MKTLSTICAVILMVSSLASAADVAGWEDFVIRQGGSPLASPAINDITYGGQAAKEFVINKASMKAAWSTNALNGFTVGQIKKLTIDRLNPTVPQINAPYFNIWITNGSGKYAVIANEPSNAEWTGNSEWNITGWDMLKTKTVKVFETTDKSWLPNAGAGLTFEDLAGFEIQAPSIAELTTGWAGLTGGAPRELGTNVAYGFNWVFGDTLANYVNPADQGYIVTNPTAVPEPATMALLGLGGLLCRRFKKA